MTAYMIKSDYYSRTFVGITSEKPQTPQKEGDIFIDVTTDKKYIAHGGTWNEVSCL